MLGGPQEHCCHSAAQLLHVNNGTCSVSITYQLVLTHHWSAMLTQSENLRCDVKQREELSVIGRNWGQATIEGGTLVFTVAGKPAFRIPLKDVGQVRLITPGLLSEAARLTDACVSCKLSRHALQHSVDSCRSFDTMQKHTAVCIVLQCTALDKPMPCSARSTLLLHAQLCITLQAPGQSKNTQQ